jgi:hypothetical protein
MQKDVLQYTLFHALDNGGKGTFKDLMTSPVAFVPSANLGKVYGVTAPAGGGQMTLAADQRSGLLTRAAMLVESDESTSPIQRGARMRRKLLCAPIAPPDPSAFPPNTIVPPPFSPTKSARQRWTEQTSQGVCNACHSQFNPLGYALENYDSLGRFRQMEPIIDPKTNKVVNSLPIDAAVDVQLVDKTATVNGAVGLGAALADDTTARQCFAQEWMKFGYGRMEAPEDVCLQAQLADVSGARGIREMLRQSVLAPTFRLRKVVP